MKVVVAPDSFKECASAARVAEAIRDGWLRARSGDFCVSVPMADGGEGTLDALAGGGRLEIHTAEVTGPMGGRVTARFGHNAATGTAVVEMAEASGLHLVPPARRNPMTATTRGTGELIRAALDLGARKIIVCIGGSATNDGGAGMAQALGASLRDKKGGEIPPGGAALAKLDKVCMDGFDKRLAGCGVAAACDVDNPLCGPTGASHVFGPQKGASPEQAEVLDAALNHYAGILRRDLTRDVRDLPGAGAAGGLAAGLMAFLGAHLIPGVDMVAEQAGLITALAGADLVITGEGSLDGQSMRGKVVSGVARLCGNRGIPVLALAGRLGAGHNGLRGLGLTAAFALADGPMSPEESMRRALELLEARAEALARCWSAAKGEAVP